VNDGRVKTALRGRVVVVVGASGGIGSATVRALYRRGATLALAAPGDALLDRIAAEVAAAGTPSIAVPTDLAQRGDIDRLVSQTVDAFGRIDVLVNAAGITSRPALTDESDADLERVVAINLLGCARTMHAILPVMMAQRSGSIVNIGSVAGEIGVMGMYSATKFGLRGLTDSVRREVRSHGIDVTLIEPGFVQTPMNPPEPKLPPPEIVANAVVAAIRRPRRCVIIPPVYRGAVLVAGLLPGILDRLPASSYGGPVSNGKAPTTRP
jgi:NAD(P)-dependent dehydrogenase (short-subunit alcohol dehydrogenase family)